MNAEDKLKYIEEDLERLVVDFERKRNRDKGKAFGLKMLTVLLSASITVLLGLKLSESINAIFSNVALVLGAAISVANAIEAFYDHRSLWIRRTVTLVRLYDLRRDIKFYVSGADKTELGVDLLSQFNARLSGILEEDLQSWLRLREQAVPRAEEREK
jgi:hypothetical protein